MSLCLKFCDICEILEDWLTSLGLKLYIYIYMCLCVCVCVCISDGKCLSASYPPKSGKDSAHFQGRDATSYKTLVFRDLK